MKLLLTLLLSLLSVHASIIITKTIQSENLVAGVQQTVAYTVFNLSPTDTYTDVVIKDNTFRSNRNFTMMNDAKAIKSILPMQNATTLLEVTPLLCKYRDKPAHVTYSVGKYRKSAKSAALGFTFTVSKEAEAERKAQKGYSRELYNMLALTMVLGPLGMYVQMQQ